MTAPIPSTPPNKAKSQGDGSASIHGRDAEFLLACASRSPPPARPHSFRRVLEAFALGLLVVTGALLIVLLGMEARE